MVRINISYKFMTLLLACFLLSACAINDKQQKQWLGSGQSLLSGLSKKPLTEQDIAAGLKEALKIGADRVVAQVGKNNGYLHDKDIHISLPPDLQKVHNTLNKVGLGKYTTELEVKMNRAAEIAAPKAKELFWTAIQEMRWQDVNAIYKGNNDAATQYFKIKMTPALRKMMRPVIRQVLSEVGVVQAYKQAVKQYHSIPFVPRVQYDMEAYVMDKGIKGIFYYLSKEEAAIRKDPTKRTTELLRRVFSSN